MAAMNGVISCGISFTTGETSFQDSSLAGSTARVDSGGKHITVTIEQNAQGGGPDVSLEGTGTLTIVGNANAETWTGDYLVTGLAVAIPVSGGTVKYTYTCENTGAWTWTAAAGGGPFSGKDCTVTFS